LGDSEPHLNAPSGWEVDLGRRELRANGVPVPIGGRAFEIIETLVKAVGELVTRDEIMRRVWPGAIVEENTIQVHISAIRKALGTDRQLLKTLSGRGYRLLGDWRVRQSVKPDAPEGSEAAPTSYLTNIPVAAGALIGRDAAVRHVEDLLSAYRAVTLTGPGGIGKTGLAAEVARQIFPRFEGAVVFVELVSLADPELVPTAVASALGLQLGGGEISSASVARAIGGHKLLLVLDNCEHVVGAAATIVEALLRGCPRTTILSTSREFLRIEGEQVYRVPPLGVPTRDQTDPDELLRHSAVQLFIVRTKSLGFDAFPRGDDLPAIAAICGRLDGIPLAIELAAARATTLGIHELAGRLDDLLGLLRAGRRTALPRHQTLRATIDWSYELLPQEERRLLRHLAVFHAGFTLSSAAAVLGDTDAGSSVADATSNLVSKSFVSLDGATPNGRWRLLETTRAYALEKLTETGEVGPARQRHAEFFLDLVRTKAPISLLGSRTPGLDDCRREIDNTRAALDWAFSTGDNLEIGAALTAAHVPVWFDASMLIECRDRAERALQCLKPSSSPRLHMQLRLALGCVLLVTLGPVERGRQLLSEALQAAEGLGDADAQLCALWGLWTLCLETGECNEAQDIAERFFAVSTRSGDSAILPVAHWMLGYSLHHRGNQTEARRHLERACELSDRTPSGYGGWFLYDQDIVARAMLACVVWLQGSPDEALIAVEASLAEALAAGSLLTVCLVLTLAVLPITLMTGDRAAAERAQSLLAETAARNSFRQFTRLERCFQGGLLMTQGKVVAGVALLRAELEDSDSGGGTNYSHPIHRAVLASGLAELGLLEAARSTIDRALAGAEAGGQSWCLVELLRTKGELLVRDGPESLPLAEAQFRGAIEIAREQGALFWELRAAVSLAKLLQADSRADEGRAILTSVYNRVTEGFETVDMRAARALLGST